MTSDGHPPNTPNVTAPSTDQEYSDSEDEFEVERILHEEHHDSDQSLWYLVKCVDRPLRESFFHPATALHAFPSIIAEWEDTKRRRENGDEAAFDVEGFIKAQAENPVEDHSEGVGATEDEGDLMEVDRQTEIELMGNAQGVDTASSNPLSNSITNHAETPGRQTSKLMPPIYHDPGSDSEDSEPLHAVKRRKIAVNAQTKEEMLAPLANVVSIVPHTTPSGQESDDDKPLIEVKRQKVATHPKEQAAASLAKHVAHSVTSTNARNGASSSTVASRKPTDYQRQLPAQQPSINASYEHARMADIEDTISASLDNLETSSSKPASRQSKHQSHTNGETPLKMGSTEAPVSHPADAQELESDTTVPTSRVSRIRVPVPRNDCPDHDSLVDSSDESVAARLQPARSKSTARTIEARTALPLRPSTPVEMDVESRSAQKNVPRTPLNLLARQILPSTNSATRPPMGGMSALTQSPAQSPSSASNRSGTQTVHSRVSASPIKIMKPKRQSKQATVQQDKQLFATVSERYNAQRKAAQERSPNLASLTFIDMHSGVNSKPIDQLLAESEQGRSQARSTAREIDGLLPSAPASKLPSVMQHAATVKSCEQNRSSLDTTTKVRPEKSIISLNKVSPLKSVIVQRSTVGLEQPTQTSQPSSASKLASSRKSLDSAQAMGNYDVRSEALRSEIVVPLPPGKDTRKESRSSTTDNTHSPGLPTKRMQTEYLKRRLSYTSNSSMGLQSTPTSFGRPFSARTKSITEHDPRASITCHYWTRGCCHNGDKCPWLHDFSGQKSEMPRSYDRPVITPRAPRGLSHFPRPAGGYGSLLNRLFLEKGISIRYSLEGEHSSFSCELAFMFEHEKYDATKRLGNLGRVFSVTKMSSADCGRRYAASVAGSNHLSIGVVCGFSGASADVFADARPLIASDEVGVIEGDASHLVIFTANARNCEALGIPWLAAANSSTLFRLLLTPYQILNTRLSKLSSLRLYYIVASDVFTTGPHDRPGDLLAIVSASHSFNMHDDLAHVFKAMGYHILPRPDLRTLHSAAKLNLVLHGSVDPSGIVGLRHCLCKGLDFKVAGIEDDGVSPLQPRTMFPFSEVVLLTDDIIVHQPTVAAEIMGQITSMQGGKRSRQQPHGRIVTRPDVKNWLISLMQKSPAHADADHSAMDHLWKAYIALCPEKDEDVSNRPVPGEQSLLVSLDGRYWPDYAQEWERNPDQCLSKMVNWFAAWSVLHKYDYRQFVALHENKKSGDTMMLDEHGRAVPSSTKTPPWADQYHHLQVMTPERWLQIKRKQAARKD